MKQGWLKSAHLYACWFSAPVVNVGGAGKHRLTLKLQEIKRNYQGFLLCCHNMETWSTHELWKEKTLPQYIGNLYIYPVTFPSTGTIFHIHPENYTLRMLHTCSINWNRMWYTLSLTLATLRCKRRGILCVCVVGAVFDTGFLCDTLAVLELFRDQAALKFRDLPASAFQVLWLKVCAGPTPG